MFWISVFLVVGLFIKTYEKLQENVMKREIHIKFMEIPQIQGYH